MAPQCRTFAFRMGQQSIRDMEDDLGRSKAVDGFSRHRPGAALNFIGTVATSSAGQIMIPFVNERPRRGAGSSQTGSSVQASAVWLGPSAAAGMVLVLQIVALRLIWLVLDASLAVAHNITPGVMRAASSGSVQKLLVACQSFLVIRCHRPHCGLRQFSHYWRYRSWV